MEPWQFLPDGYEPPLGEEQFSIEWRSDLGPNVPVGGVGAYLQAFQTLLDLGERWGLVMAEEAAARSSVNCLLTATLEVM